MNPADLSELVMLRREAKTRQEARMGAWEAAVEDMRASFETRLDEIAALANDALARAAEALAMAQSKAAGGREDAGGRLRDR
jgi:hypothetical protein